MDMSKHYKGGPFGTAGGRIPEKKKAPALPPPISAPGHFWQRYLLAFQNVTTLTSLTKFEIDTRDYFALFKRKRQKKNISK